MSPLDDPFSRDKTYFLTYRVEVCGECLKAGIEMWKVNEPFHFGQYLRGRCLHL